MYSLIGNELGVAWLILLLTCLVFEFGIYSGASEEPYV